MTAVDHPTNVVRIRDADQRLNKLASAAEANPNSYVPFALLARHGITFSRVHLMRLVAREEFPAPVTLSARRIAWKLHEVLAWLDTRPKREATHYEKTSG